MRPSYLSLLLALSLFSSLHPIISVPLDDYNFLDNDNVIPPETDISPPPPPISRPPSSSPSRSPNASPIPSPTSQVIISPSSSPSGLPHISPSSSPPNSRAPSSSPSRSPSRAPHPSPRSSPFPSPSSNPDPTDSLTSLFSSSSLFSNLATQFLQPICDKTRNSDLCMSTLQSVAPSDITTLDPLEGFKLFTKAMENDTQDTIDKAMQHMNEAATDETKKAYKSCADDFSNVVSNLQDIIDAIARNDMYAAKSNLDSALHTDNCDEFMSKFPDLQVGGDRDKLQDLVGVALDIWMTFVTPTYSKVQVVDD